MQDREILKMKLFDFLINLRTFAFPRGLKDLPTQEPKGVSFTFTYIQNGQKYCVTFEIGSQHNCCSEQRERNACDWM